MAGGSSVMEDATISPSLSPRLGVLFFVVTKRDCRNAAQVAKAAKIGRNAEPSTQKSKLMSVVVGGLRSIERKNNVRTAPSQQLTGSSWRNSVDFI